MNETGIICLSALSLVSGLVGIVIWLLFLRKDEADDMLKKVIETHNVSIRAQQEIWNTMIKEREIMASEREGYIQDRAVLIPWLTQFAKSVDERNAVVESNLRLLMRELINEAMPRIVEVLGGAAVVPSTPEKRHSLSSAL